MEKTGIPIWGKALIVVVLVGIAWAAFQYRRESARIDELAALPPCRLAANYMEWRLAYEDARAAAENAGSVPGSFIDQSELFEEAARRAQRDSQSRLLEELESLTMVDSAGWVRGGGDIDDFVEVMISECPDEVRELIGGANR